MAEEAKGDDQAPLYANRSAAFAAKMQFSEALGDAESAIKLKSTWSKGYYRKGQALEGLMRLPEANIAYKAGLDVDPKDDILSKAYAELSTQLEDIAKTQAESVKKFNPETDRFEAMCNWLRGGGGKFPYLYLQYYDEDYRGVHALTRIPNDKIILEVPLPLIMTSEVAKDSDIGKKIINSGCKLRSTHSYLAAFLCQEKHKKNSFWAPYIRILPQNYRNMPIFFEEGELKLLKGSFSLKKIADRKEDLLAEYENICKHAPEFRQYTHKEFVWARLAVITRIFGLVINGNKTDGLVPMADMLNHKRPRDSKGDDDGNHSETSWTFDDKRNAFTITSLKALNRGDQIYDSYGRKCNSRFFVNYGFSLEENEDNQAVIPLSIPQTDPHFQMKLRFLGGHPSSTKRKFQIPIQYKEKETKEAFSFARFAFAKDSEIMVLSSADDFKIDDIEPISIRNEIQVLQALANSARKQLSYFETTLEEDNKILSDLKTCPMYSNYRNGILMRRGEKEVLHYYIKLADTAIPLLEQDWKEIKKRAAKMASGKGEFDQYVTHVVVPLVKAGGQR
jgi:histone-lysine N-methyltransferase SETD3